MFVLASKSPRRAELFGYITDNFEILPSENEENIPDNVKEDIRLIIKDITF